MNFEDLMVNDDIVKIAKHASSRFTNTLTKDEIYTCVLNAIWKAKNNHDPKKGSKFTTYLYNGIIMECLTQQKFNRGKTVVSVHNNVANSRDYVGEIDLLDEVKNCENADIMIDHFYKNKSIKEIAKEQGVSGETIRVKIKKNLEKLKTRIG